MGPDGALIVDKPPGPTSHDVVSVARRALGTRQIGHAGTLDPLATGVLVLLLGRATRLAQFIVQDEKEYLAEIRLGTSTATYDAEGLAEGGTSRMDQSGSRALDVASLSEVLDSYRGTFLQTPPPFSAKKIAGRRAYEHARQERAVELAPVEVTVSELERLPAAEPLLLRLRLVVSAGFYVRSLAHDIGQRLGCGAHLEALRRTRSGAFTIDEAVTLDALVAGPVAPVPLNRLVGHLPSVTLSEDGLRLARHGNRVGAGHVAEGAATGTNGALVRLFAPGGDLVAIAQRHPGGLLHPQVVLV